MDASPSAENISAERKDIMLADDDMDELLIFEAALDELGFPYQLRHANNGNKLLLLLKEKVPDILFLDIRMPLKDGVSCISEIRKHREYDSLPVIMYSSNIAPNLTEECFANGANFYLQKANTVSILSERLGKIFSIDQEKFLDYTARDNFVLP